MARTEPERLAITVIPGAGRRAVDIRTVAREAAAAGFEAICTTEVNSGTLITAQVMGSLGLSTFLGDDLDVLRDVARQNLARYTGFPFFRRMWRESGFGAEVDEMERGAGPAALSAALLDSFCLTGPVSRCRERIGLPVRDRRALLAQRRVVAVAGQDVERPGLEVGHQRSDSRARTRSGPDRRGTVWRDGRTTPALCRGE